LQIYLNRYPKICTIDPPSASNFAQRSANKDSPSADLQAVTAVLIFSAYSGVFMRLISWNINGIRAIAQKGFLDWLKNSDADIIALQETKARPEQIPAELYEIEGYKSYWFSAEKKGYSGVGFYSRYEPEEVEYGLGIPIFDSEGRTLILTFPEFTLYGCYFPNGQRGGERLAYKLAFYDAFLNHIEKRRKNGRQIIFCGDVNTAHKEIDLARPKENAKTSGFLPEERAWIDKLIEHGYIDTFREFCAAPQQYSWWNMRTRARDRNVGWRIDYFFINREFRRQLQNAFIWPEVQGSDHCPVGIDINLKNSQAFSLPRTNSPKDAR
jgi:exodeoxyribonuclease-3